MNINKFDISKLSGNRTFNPALVGYEDSIDIIGDELQNTRKSFVKIGWYLKHIDEENMYQKDGYEDIYEFAHAKFKMKKGTVNRFINICKQFSVNHDSPELDEHYQEFDESQLFEMLPMKETEREGISPDMTVKQIREKKAENKAIREPSEDLVEMFLHERVNLSEFNSVSELKEFLVERFGKSKCGGGPDPNYECTARGIKLEDYDEITWLAFAKKAWNLKELDPPEPSKAHGVQEEESDIAAPVPTAAFIQAAVPEPGEDVVASACEDNHAALLEEAYSLSQKLYEGFRFSAKNHTLSQIEDYTKLASKLNNVAHTLYDLCLSKK